VRSPAGRPWKVRSNPIKAKQPRVNPGTLLGHPRLAALLVPADRAALAALPAGELWDLERKSDVDLDSIYGTAPSSSEVEWSRWSS
jgi:hypothetical protein